MSSGVSTFGGGGLDKPSGPEEEVLRAGSSVGFLARLSVRVHGFLSAFFYRKGVFIARYPKIIIMLTVALAFCCAAGFANFQQESNAEKLYTPQSAIAFTHRDIVEDAFGQPSFRCQVFAESKKGNEGLGVMSKDALLELFDAHEAVVRAQVKVDGETITFAGSGKNARCKRDDANTCAPLQGALSPWAHNRTKLENDADHVNTAINFFKANEQQSLESAFGGIRKDEKGVVTGARAATMIFELVREDEPIKGEPDGDKRSEALQLEMDKRVLELKTSHARILPLTEEGQDQVAGEALARDSSTLLSGSYFICILFGMYVLSQNNLVHSHMHLALWSVVSVGLSIMVSFGICNAAGIKFNSVVATLAFLLLGLGLDDTYVIMANYARVTNDERTKHLHSDERMARALSRAGSAITVTSITDFCAFAVGTATVLPALRDFCAYAAVGILADFFFQTTFFYAIAVLDARREDAKKMDCCCCFSVSEAKQTSSFCGSTPGTYDPKDPGSFTRFMGSTFPRVITSPVGKAVVLLVGVGLVVMGIVGSTQLETDFNIDWFVPDGTLIKETIRLRDRYWSGQNLPYAAFTQSGDYYTARDELEALCKAVKENKWTLKDSTRCWYDDYKTYQSNGGCDTVNDGASFAKCVHTFVSSPAGKRYNASVVFENFECGTVGTSQPACQIKASRVDALMVTLSNSRTQIKGMDETRIAVSVACPSLKSFAYSFIFIFIEGYKVIAWETLRNVLLAGVCVFLICVVLLANVQAAALVLFMVVCIDVCILGIGLKFLGFTFNSVTCILVVISVGLAVDYSAHVAHSFLSAEGDEDGDDGTNDARVRQALKHMCVPVLNGGLSTWFACCMLMFATSYVFTTYFLILTMIVIISLFYGLCVLPVLLSFVGPRGVAVAEGAALDIESAKEGRASPPSPVDVAL